MKYCDYFKYLRMKAVVGEPSGTVTITVGLFTRLKQQQFFKTPFILSHREKLRTVPNVAKRSEVCDSC